MTAVALGDVADVNPRMTSRPSGDDSVAFVPMAELDAVSATTSSGETRPFSEVSKGYTIFENGDLLVAKITPCFENNKIGQARLDHTVGVGSSEFHVVRPNRELVDDRYLLHFLRQDCVRIDGERRMTGSGGQRRVPPAFLKELKVPLPTLNEQRRTAAILDQVDALRAKRRQALAHLDDLPQSIFLDMFGTALATRERVPLKTLTEVITKGTTPTSVGLKFTDAGVPFLRVQNLVRGTVRFGTGDLFIDAGAHQTLARSQVHPGDLLVSIAGTIGRCAVVPDDSPEMNCNQAVALVRLADRVFAPWVMGWLSTGDAKAQMGAASVTATISNLSLGQLGALQVPTVSRAEVKLFRDRLAAVDRANEIAAANSAGVEALFQSLQAHVFRGDL